METNTSRVRGSKWHGMFRLLAGMPAEVPFYPGERVNEPLRLLRSIPNYHGYAYTYMPHPGKFTNYPTKYRVPRTANSFLMMNFGRPTLPISISFSTNLKPHIDRSTLRTRDASLHL